MSKKLIAVTVALTLCAALTGCTEKAAETLAETSAAALETTSAATVSTTAETSETTETTTVSETPATVRTTTVTEKAVPKVDLDDLKAVYGEKLYTTRECRIIDDIMCESEEDFPMPEHIALARKTAFADENCRKIIADFNENAADEEGFVYVGTEDDLPFTKGASYDFDGDGELESVVTLDLSPAKTWIYGSGAVYYIDGENIFCISDGDGNRSCYVRAFDFGVKTFVEIDTFAGASTQESVLYSADNGTLEPVILFNGSSQIGYFDGVIYYWIKYDNFSDYPIVFCEDGKLRQLGKKKITEEDFSAHLENGREYLDFLKSEKNVTGIYTAGHYQYQIDTNDGIIVFYIDGDGNAVQQNLYYGIYDRELTEELDYDIDVFALDVIPYGE